MRSSVDAEHDDRLQCVESEQMPASIATFVDHLASLAGELAVTSSAFSGTFSRISSSTLSGSMPSASASKFENHAVPHAPAGNTRRTSSKLTL